MFARCWAYDEQSADCGKNLTIGYGDFVLLKDLNFNINRGDVFIIMGGSGCGKSSMLRVLTGLVAPQKGTVVIDGTDFTKAAPAVRDEIMRRSGILYQSGALFSSMTLAENIALPLEQYTGYSEREISELVSLKLALVGLSGFEDFYPSEISGGMKNAPVWRARWRLIRKSSISTSLPPGLIRSVPGCLTT